MAGIRKLTVADIPEAKELSDAEGWNQTTSDWELLITAPGNFSVALTENEKLIGTATVMTYAGDMAWVGMVLVNQEYRGRGFGRVLMGELSGRLKSFPSVMLDATPAGQSVYLKYGYNNVCWIYRMVCPEVHPEKFHDALEISVEKSAAGRIPEIMNYDKQVTGINRGILLKYLINDIGGPLHVASDKGRVSGYLTGRAGIRFCQLGPLVAETAAHARALLASLLSCFPGQPVVLDVPEDKLELMYGLEEAGFEVQRRFMRMSLDGKHLWKVPGNYFLTAGPEFG